MALCWPTACSNYPAGLVLLLGAIQTSFTFVKVKVAQLCPTLCDPMDYAVHEILQARILEWVAFPFSRDLSNSGIKPGSHVLQADSLPAEPQGKPLDWMLCNPIQN